MAIGDSTTAFMSRPSVSGAALPANGALIAGAHAVPPRGRCRETTLCAAAVMHINK
jgi:hypothetical protein